MLPRVNAALRKFISPISESIQKVNSPANSSSQSTQDRRLQPPPFQQKNKQPKQQPNNPTKAPLEAPAENSAGPALKLVVNNEKKSPANPMLGTSTPQITSGPQQEAPLFQILAIVKEQKDAMVQWLGLRSYGKASKTQRKKFRKGAMVDHNS